MSATAQRNGRDVPVIELAPQPTHTVMPETLAAALSAFQGAVPTFPKTKTARVQTRTGGEYSYKYADLGDILPIVGPLLAQVGLSWTAKPRRAETGEMVLAYRLLHVSGETDDGEIPLGVAPDCKPQELGSAITYARRYALTAQLNLSTEQDDDGQGAQDSEPSTAGTQQPRAKAPSGGGRPATTRQQDMLRKKAEAAKLPVLAFANVLKEASGEQPSTSTDEAAAERYLSMALSRLPATKVDDVIAGIAHAEAEGSQS